MRELLYVIATPLATLTALAAFTAWWTAGLYVTGLCLFGLYAVRRHEKHHRAQVFDDKLSTDRMEAARKWLTED